MKKDITMKKNNLISGAMITTIGIVITKILGILYVIPFHSLIGEKGGALYGYAYTIYLFFMSLASAGIPLAISKIVAEYQTLGYLQIKNRVFILGRRISILLGIICFLIIMLLAPLLAKAILGNISGGNTIEDVTFVIRVIGMAILIVPLLSVYRGYFEGHRFMSPPSISQIIEQLIRVLIIVFGSYLSIKVFHLNLTTVVGVSLFGAVVGAFIAYLYLVQKRIRNKSRFHSNVRKVNEPIVSDKVLVKKIFYYAIPFIGIDIFKTIYNYVDMVSVVKNLVYVADYSVGDAETIYAMLSTWGAKFNMIVLAVSTGVIVSLVPNLANSVAKKDKKGINYNICRSLEILFLFMIPITLGICFLAKPIWTLFYGKSIYGANLLSYYIYVGLFIGLFTAMVTILQTLNDYKMVFISLIVGVIIKIVCNKYLLVVFYQMNLPAYYGVITATILGYFTSFIIALVYVKRRYQISFEKTTHYFIDIICGAILMFIMMFLLKFIVPIYSNNRIINIPIIIIYTLVGGIVYFVYTYKMGIIQHVFGKSLINKLFFRKK